LYNPTTPQTDPLDPAPHLLAEHEVIAMPGRPPLALSLALTLLVAGVAWGQGPKLDDPPKVFVPKKPPTQQELDRRESLHQFIEGLLCEREDRLLEALKAYQEAARLDPQAAGVFKAQVPILLGLERGPDAVEACRKVVELDPDDFDTWALLARLHKAMARYPEARAALQAGLKAAGIDGRPELAQQMYFDLGTLCEADGQFAAAADAYSRSAALLDHPDVIAEHAGVGKELVLQRAAETYERIGDLYRKAKKYDQAVAAYVKAQERAPLRAERLNFNLAQVCVEKGDDARALPFLDAYLRTQPLGMDAYEMKIALWRRAGKDADILPWLEEAAKRDVHNVALHLVLARECGKAKQGPRAEKLYHALAETSPSAELYRGLLRLYHDDAQAGPARALALLDQALARGARKDLPDPLAVAQAKAMIGVLREEEDLARTMVGAGIKAVTKGTPLRFETVFLLATLAASHRQNAEAERLYRACFKQMPDDAETLVYTGMVRVLGKARRYEALLQVCDGALGGDPQQGLPKAQTTNQVLFLSEKARALAALRRYDEALQAADRALLVAADTNKTLVRHLRVRLLLMANRTAEAEKECEAMLQQSTQPAEVLEVRYLLSSVYAAAKQNDRSEEQLRLILKADPDNATANNDLGYLWADQGKNLEEAEAMIRRAIEQDRRLRKGSSGPSSPAPPPPAAGPAAAEAVEGEDNAAFVDSLGWVLYRRGKVAEARKELERAAALPDGEDPVIWEHLGDVYRDLRMPTEARRAWERALQLYDEGQRRIDAERYQELQRKAKDVPAGPR
jgi:tetratricopeptide (TPR) repeat protein